MLAYGRVSEVDFDKMLVKVIFEQDDDMPSGWMPVVVPGMYGRKHTQYPASGALVACIMEEGFHTGVVLGELPTAKAAPTITGEGFTGVEFEDGTQAFFDANTHTLNIIGADLNVNIEAGGEVNVLADGDIYAESGGSVIVNADQAVSLLVPNAQVVVESDGITIGTTETLGTVLGGLIDQILLLVFPTPMGPTLLPPLNAAAITSLKARLALILK